MARSHPCERRDSGASGHEPFRPDDGQRGQLRIFAVVALLHFGRREQAHAGAVVDPGM